MFENWGMLEWFILFINIVAIAIVVRFLTWKVRSKLAEVEQRQQFSIQKRIKNREKALASTQDE
jgi:hypothetical protein